MYMSNLTGFIITAGHLDIEWYQPMRSYRFWTVQCFEDLKVAAKRDDFKCYVLDGQVFPLEEYLEVMPGDENEIRELIKKGKLAIGPFYTQFDEWLPSPENIIRNCLYGKQKAESYGGYMKAGYLPDNFGHPRQLPQILNGFDINSLLFMRGMPEVPGDHPDEFIYQGLDGSEVLISHFRESYAGAFDLFNKKIDPIQPRIVPYYNDYFSFEWHKELADHDDPQRIAGSMISNVRRIKDRYPSGIVPLIAGFDHLPPQINIGDSVKVANETQNEINFVMGTVEDYVRAVYDSVKKKTIKPWTYDTELLGSRYQYLILGANTTRTYLKRQNFACEALMERYVEPLDALASLYGYPDKPQLLDEAWKYLMISSAHDSIHGSSVDEVHVEMNARYAAVRQIASGIIHDVLTYWGQHVEHWWEGLSNKENYAEMDSTPTNSEESGFGANYKLKRVKNLFSTKGIITYAPADPGIPQPTELWLPTADIPAVVRTPDGKVLPTQILPREKIYLNGIGKPRNDYFPAAVYRKIIFMDDFKTGSVNTHALVVSEQSSPKTDIKGSDCYIENEYIRIETDGALINLFDKKNNKTYYNLNLLEDEAEAGDAWDFSPPWIPGEHVKSTSGEFAGKLAECGPVRAVLEIRGRVNVPYELIGDKRSTERVNIPVLFVITLYSKTPRADIKLVLENNAKDHRMRLWFTPGIKSDFVRSQSHFGILDRPLERPREIEKWFQPVTRMLPFREWLAVQNEEYGLCVAVKGIYDYEAVADPVTSNVEVAMTLFRGFGHMGRLNTKQRKGEVSTAVPTPDAQCMGKQEIEWSYIPYSITKEDKAPFVNLVHAFLYPPVSHGVRAPFESSVIKDGKPIFEWENNNIRFSSFKRCLKRDGYILRLYENQGKTTNLTISLTGFSKACLSNLAEDTKEQLVIENGKLHVNVNPYKIISIKLVK
jgi:mannosylglycerate hydrolase